MQFMQKRACAERIPVGAQAICDREGQVLFAHAAPSFLSEGNYLEDCLSAGERKFLRTLPADTDVLLLCRKSTVLLRRRWLSGRLGQILPLRSPAAAFAASVSLADGLGLVVSPGMLAMAEESHPQAEQAAAELMYACSTTCPQLAGYASAESLFAALAALPPLCARQLHVRQTLSFPMNEDWTIIAYCLAAFLCRSTDGTPLTVNADGSLFMPVLTLSASAPVPIPSGQSRLRTLADRFPDAPELMLCNRLAARSGIAITVFSNPRGQLSICAEKLPDPSALGLKTPTGFNAEAEAAEEAEWCHLLRAAAPAKR